MSLLPTAQVIQKMLGGPGEGLKPQTFIRRRKKLHDVRLGNDASGVTPNAQATK